MASMSMLLSSLTLISICVISTKAMSIDAKITKPGQKTTTKLAPTTQPGADPTKPAPSINRPKQLRIAWFAPGRKSGDYQAKTSVDALKFALSVMKSFMLNSTDVKVKWYDSNCSAEAARTAALTARRDLDPDLILGPPCSVAMAEVASLASEWNIPVFSWGSNDPSLVDRLKYTTLVRVYPPLNSFSPVMYFLHEAFNWKRFSLVSDSREEYKSVSKALRRYVSESNFTLASNHTLDTNMTDAEIRGVFQEVQNHARIVLLSVPWSSMRRYILLAQELNMTFGDYAFVCFNNDLHNDDNHELISDYMWFRNDSFDELAQAAFESVIHIITDITNMNFSFNKLKRFLNQSGEIASVNVDLPASGNGEVDMKAAYLYDATMLWSHFANVIISEGGDVRNGSRMMELVRDADVIGFTGRVEMNHHGDRLANVMLLDMDASGMFNDFLHIQNKADGGAILTRPFFECRPDPGVFQNTCSYDVMWPNGLTGGLNAPFDTPMCGFQGELCEPTQ